MSDRSTVSELMQIETPPTPSVQPSGESSLTNVSLSSFSSPASNSIAETLPSLASNKSNDQPLVNACASGGRNEVNGNSILGGSQRWEECPSRPNDL